MQTDWAKNWESLLNDGDNYGGAHFSPLEKLIIECIKDKTVLKIEDRFQFSKTGDASDPNHGPNLAKALAGFTALQNIKALIITHNALGPEGVAILAASPVLTNLTYLHLGSNRLGDEGARIVAECPLFANVQTLNLECNGIQADGAIALATSPYLKNLTTLNLVDNKIGDTGALAIANSSNFTRLTYLHIGGNKIKSEETKNALRGSANLPNLKTLKIF